jgi:phosphoribosyl-ATP pyrophosphohydrolase/phosphoribosyl-AMP cyclohydrolase
MTENAPVACGRSGGEHPVGIADLDGLDFAKGGGLLPAIVQDAANGAVLMLGYMNREALEATLTRGRVVFFSRSKGRLWEKGEVSGHSLELECIYADCDRDALLVTARPSGAVCHLGTNSCFGDPELLVAEPSSILGKLESTIRERRELMPKGSYTARLLAGGVKSVAQKVGEEGVEVALAAAAGTDTEVVAEVSDLLYHVLVLLQARGLCLQHVLAELLARHAARRGAT